MINQPSPHKDWEGRHSQGGDHAPFRLMNEPPRPAPSRFGNLPAGKQSVLFSGLDCLPGQLDLFAEGNIDE